MGDTARPGDEVVSGAPDDEELVCPECRGSGRLVNIPCRNCNGTGVVRAERSPD